MNRIVIIAFAILLSMTALFGYISYHLKGSLAKAEQALVLSENARLKGEKALLNRDLSCKIDDTSVVEVEKEKKELQTKVETLSEQIASLKNKKLLTKPITTTTKDEVKSQLIGNEMLSEELVMLLNNSYCTVEPSSSECLKSNSP